MSVPATLQATIAARIDRLDPQAKRTLIAAAVIGSRFGLDLLTVLGVEPVVADLLAAELIDQVRFTPTAGVCVPPSADPRGGLRVSAQVGSSRAASARRGGDRNQRPGVGRRECGADRRAPGGRRRPARRVRWHMRAGAWSTNRDIAAAHLSWERARQVADALPTDDPDRLAMRIAPRTLICGNAGWVHADISGTASRNCGSCAARLTTKRRWPSAWPGCSTCT